MQKTKRVFMTDCDVYRSASGVRSAGLFFDFDGVRLAAIARCDEEREVEAFAQAHDDVHESWVHAAFAAVLATKFLRREVGREVLRRKWMCHVSLRLFMTSTSPRLANANETAAPTKVKYH